MILHIYQPLCRNPINFRIKRSKDNQTVMEFEFYKPDEGGRIMVWRGRLSVDLSGKLVNTIQT